MALSVCLFVLFVYFFQVVVFSWLWANFFHETACPRLHSFPLPVVALFGGVGESPSYALPPVVSVGYAPPPTHSGGHSG